MADPSSRRKLAATLSADVVGYSRLMAANEAATVETLKSYRDIIARLVVRRGGRVVNAPGAPIATIRVHKGQSPHSLSSEMSTRLPTTCKTARRLGASIIEHSRPSI